MAETMQNFKTHAMASQFPRIYSSIPMPDPKHLAVHLMARVIPEMDKRGECAFAWHFAGNDVCSYTPQEYESEIARYKDLKLKCDKGDTKWYYEFKNKEGKMRRCEMETSIWYNPNGNHSVSPTAMVFAQFMGAGIHIVKCSFSDVA